MKRGRKHQRTSSAFGGDVGNIKGKNQKKKGGKKLFKKTMYTFFLCFFIFLIACVGIGAGMYAAIVREIEDMNVEELALSRSSVVYYNDENGNAVEAEYLSSSGNTIWVETDEISPLVKEAIVAIEDERFYRHGGIDIKRTAGAVLGYVREKLGGPAAGYGGSTITQQVIKNITSEKDRTATRKIKEMMRAVALEKQLSKDEILTIYLNVIYLSNNCYGVEAASNRFFGKNASELNLTESALIAGITQKPSYYDPLANPENATKKRNTVLSKMYETGKITKEEYEEAVEKGLGIHESDIESRKNIYNYFVDAMIDEVIADLQEEKGYTKTFAKQQLFSGGLRIYTTMDAGIQNSMESVFENSQNFPSGAKQAQSAMMIIDHSNGEIKGIIGGKGEKTDSRGFNRATHMRRQPGSSIKPLSVYAPAFETKKITPSTIVVDEPMTIKEKNWSPKNSYSGYKGSMSVKKAIEISANIPAIKILQKVGVDTSFDYVKNKFRIGVENSDKDLSPLSLGSLTKGATVEEMAAAYQAFANGGYYYTPHTYTKVVDSKNRVLLEKKVEKKQIIGADTAYTMSKMLYGVVNSSSGTGKAAKLDADVSVYGKTGTTNEDKDKWFVGYTQYYVGAVWFGFDTPSSIRNAGITSNISAQIWKKVMEKVHDGKTGSEIKMPENMVEAYVCTSSGLLANSQCNGKTEYFIDGSQPKKYCTESHSKSNKTEQNQLTDDDDDDEESSGSVQSGSVVSPTEDTPPKREEPVDIAPIEPETSRPQIETN